MIGMSVLTLGFLAGCASPPGNYIVLGSGTTLALDASYNAATATPQGTLGYKRAEMAVVRYGTNEVAPDVLMEFQVTGFWSFGSDSKIWDRIAIGKNATTATPASLMMSKTKRGQSANGVSVEQVYRLNSLINTNK